MKFTFKTDSECGWYMLGSQALGFAAGLAASRWHIFGWWSIGGLAAVHIACMCRSTYCKFRDEEQP